MYHEHGASWCFPSTLSPMATVGELREGQAITLAMQSKREEEAST